MARTSQNKSGGSGQDINKSDEIRKLFTENPKLKAREVIDALAERGIKVTGGLVYLIKSKMKATRRREKRENASRVVSSNGHGDPVATIRKVKALAGEVGGLSKLRLLVEALSE